MFNAIRMDIYRLVHTKSTYIILIITIALAIMMAGTTALVQNMTEEALSESTDAVVYNENDSELANEFAITDTTGVEVESLDMSQETPTIVSMVETDMTGRDVALLLAIFTVLFSTADLNSGYIKSVGGQVKDRGVLLFSKMIALVLFTLVAMALDVIAQCIATPLFLHGAKFGDVAELFKMLGCQYIVTLCLVCFIMAIAIMIKNNVISMIIAVCMCTGIFTLIFSGINLLIDKIGIKDFDINNYIIVNKIYTLGLGASSKTISSAFVVALIWAVISIIAVYNVFSRRDI